MLVLLGVCYMDGVICMSLPSKSYMNRRPLVFFNHSRLSYFVGEKKQNRKSAD